MIRWLNRILPQPGIVYCCLIGYALFVGGMAYLEWNFGASFRQDEKRGFALVCLPGLAAFAVWRVVGFHPFWRPGLRDWLKATPWTGRRPLPFGPVNLTVQDLFIIAVAVGLNWLMVGPLAWPSVFCFPIVYLIVLAIVLFLTGAWQYGYASIFGIGLVLFLHDNRPASVLALMATYLTAWYGLRASLAQFPWSDGQRKELAEDSQPTPHVEEVPPSRLAWQKEFAKGFKSRAQIDFSGDPGWPYSHIAPRTVASQVSVPTIHAVLGSVLAGWVFFVVLSFIQDIKERSETTAAICFGVCLFAPGIRLMTYVFSYRSPARFLVRLATGQWFVPGYDSVYVTPLLAFCAGVTCSLLLHGQPAGEAVYLSPGVVSLVIFICLSLGPGLRDWQLTGKHNLQMKVRNANYIQVG
jgi:hypothetical protein